MRREWNSPRRRVAATATMVALAVTGAIGLTACSDDEQPEPRDEQQQGNDDDTEQTSPEGEDASDPTTDLPEASEPYVQVALEYYEEFNQAQQTGDGEPLRELSTSECQACQMAAQVVEETEANGGHYEDGEMRPVSDAPIEPTSNGETATVTITYEREAGVFLNEEGGEPAEFDAGRTEETFELKQEEGRWLITAITTEELGS